MKTHLFVVAMVILLLCAPGAMAGPLPNPEDLPNPLEPQPRDAGTQEQLQQILGALYPNEVPFNANCVKTDEDPYDPAEHSGNAVSTSEDNENVIVRVRSGDTVYTIKIKKDCFGN